MDGAASMFTADALRLELYDDWAEPPVNTGSRDAPIDLECDLEAAAAHGGGGIKLEDLWKQQCPEVVDLSSSTLDEELMVVATPFAGQLAAVGPALQQQQQQQPRPSKPEPDAFERYLKVKMKKLDRKRRQAEEEAQRYARERADIIDGIDALPEAGEEGLQLGVELAAWETRVRQLGSAVLAAKAGRKLTRLKMDLREYRRKKEMAKPITLD